MTSNNRDKWKQFAKKLEDFEDKWYPLYRELDKYFDYERDRRDR